MLNSNKCILLYCDVMDFVKCQFYILFQLKYVICYTLLSYYCISLLKPNHTNLQLFLDYLSQLLFEPTGFTWPNQCLIFDDLFCFLSEISCNYCIKLSFRQVQKHYPIVQHTENKCKNLFLIFNPWCHAKWVMWF